jgi:Family of unknown function (DUF5335)
MFPPDMASFLQPIIKMSTSVIPHDQWNDWLQSFTSRHAGWLVTIETHDLQTGETVRSRFMQLLAVELDLEDRKNPRINIVVRDNHQEIKHILFRPSDVTEQLSKQGTEKSLRITSLNTVTTVRFRVAASPELVDGVA